MRRGNSIGRRDSRSERSRFAGPNPRKRPKKQRAREILRRDMSEVHPPPRQADPGREDRADTGKKSTRPTNRKKRSRPPSPINFCNHKAPADHGPTTITPQPHTSPTANAPRQRDVGDTGTGDHFRQTALALRGRVAGQRVPRGARSPSARRRAPTTVRRPLSWGAVRPAKHHRRHGKPNRLQTNIFRFPYGTLAARTGRSVRAALCSDRN
jgi:hypothetical protein